MSLKQDLSKQVPNGPLFAVGWLGTFVILIAVVDASPNSAELAAGFAILMASTVTFVYGPSALANVMGSSSSGKSNQSGGGGGSMQQHYS